MNQTFLVRIEQPGRVSHLAVRGQLNALHLAQAYARQGPAQQILVLDAAGRVLWKDQHRDNLPTVPTGEKHGRREADQTVQRSSQEKTVSQ